MLARRFGSDPRRAYTSASATSLDLQRSVALLRSDAPDAGRQRRIAEALVAPVMTMAPASTRGRRHDAPAADGSPGLTPSPCTLAAVSAIAPTPDRVTDRDTYEATRGALRRARLLRSPVLPRAGPLGARADPGTVRSSSGRSYAAVGNAAASLAIFDLCLLFGLSRRGADHGRRGIRDRVRPLLHPLDPYTADPLDVLPRSADAPRTAERSHGGRRHHRGRGRAREGVRGRAALHLQRVRRGAARISRVRCGRSSRPTRRSPSGSFCSIALMLAFNYSYGGSASTDLLGGGNLNTVAREAESQRRDLRDAERVHRLLPPGAVRLPVRRPSSAGSSRSCRFRWRRSSPTCSSRTARCGTFTFSSCRLVRRFSIGSRPLSRGPRSFCSPSRTSRWVPSGRSRRRRASACR